MGLLLDENMSDRRLAARLGAQGHDPVLATGVGLLSATDARVFIAAITQALPVLTRDSEDFTDLHDLIMAAGGHHSGVLVVRDPEQVRKLAGWGLTQNDILPRQQRRSYTNPKRERGIRCVSLAGASG